MENIPVVCPRCGKDDKSEKVTSIVKSQTRTREQMEWITETDTDKDGRTHSYSYPRYNYITEITDLAKSLLPPQQPQLQYSKSNLWLALLIGWAMISCISFVIAMIFESSRFAVPIVLSICFGLSALLLLIVLYIFFQYQRHSAENKRRLAHLNEVEFPLWRKAIYKWNQLYYCYRDDIVFSQEGEWAQLPHMQNLIYN